MDYNNIYIVNCKHEYYAKDGNIFIHILSQRIITDTYISNNIQKNYKVVRSINDCPEKIVNALYKRSADFWYDLRRAKYGLLFFRYKNGSVFYSIQLINFLKLEAKETPEVPVSTSSGGKYTLNDPHKVNIYGWSELSKSTRRQFKNIHKGLDYAESDQSFKPTFSMEVSFNIHANKVHGHNQNWCGAASIHNTGNWSNVTCEDCLEEGHIRNPTNQVIINALEELGIDLEVPENNIKLPKIIHLIDEFADGAYFCATLINDENASTSDWSQVTCKSCLSEGLICSEDDDVYNLIKLRIDELNIKEKPKTKEKPQIEGKSIMKNVSDVICRAGERNKNSAQRMAKVELGQIANSKLTKLIISKAPLGAKGYMQKYPQLVGLITANLVAMAADQYAPSNRKLRIVSECMMDAAYADTLKSLKLEEQLDNLLKMIPADLLDSVMTEEEDED